jgi:hypothetical protein
VIAAAAGLAALLLAGSEPPAVTIAPCVEVRHDELRRLLDLELGASPDAADLQVVVACDGPAVKIEVRERGSGRRRGRSVDLAHTARAARARLIALATSELAAAVRGEPPPRQPAPAPGSSARPSAAKPAPLSPPPAGPLTLPLSPAPTPPPTSLSTGPPGERVGVRGPPAAAAPPLSADLQALAPPSDRRPALTLLAEAGGARFFSRLATTAELGLTLRHEGWRLLEPALVLAGSLGTVDRKGREASARSLSLAPLLGVHHHLGAVTLRAATGPRLAIGRLRASASLPGDEAGTFTAPWLAWQAQAGAAVGLGRHLLLELVLRTGYVLSPIGGRIAGDREIAVEGPWVGAALALGARL